MSWQHSPVTHSACIWCPHAMVWHGGPALVMLWRVTLLYTARMHTARAAPDCGLFHLPTHSLTASSRVCAAKYPNSSWLIPNVSLSVSGKAVASGNWSIWLLIWSHFTVVDASASVDLLACRRLPGVVRLGRLCLVEQVKNRLTCVTKASSNAKRNRRWCAVRIAHRKDECRDTVSLRDRHRVQAGLTALQERAKQNSLASAYLSDFPEKWRLNVSRFDRVM